MFFNRDDVTQLKNYLPFEVSSSEEHHFSDFNWLQSQTPGLSWHLRQHLEMSTELLGTRVHNSRACLPCFVYP